MLSLAPLAPESRVLGSRVTEVLNKGITCIDSGATTEQRSVLPTGI